MKISNIILVILFPLAAYADGVKISEFTLEAVKIALLVKVMAYNSKKGTAKVEILKKFSKNSDNSTDSTDTTDIKTQYKPSNSPNTESSEEFDINSAKVGQIATVKIKAPIKMVPRKWVMENRYWNQLSSVQDNEKTILIDVDGKFVFSPYSSLIEEKFDTLFDLKLLANKLTKASADELFLLMKDRDYELHCLDELAKRKLIDAKYISTIDDPGTFKRIIVNHLKTLSISEQDQFWLALAKLIVKADLNKQKQFLQNFYYLGSKTIDTRISVYELFNQKEDDIRQQINNFLHEAQQIYKNNDLKILSKIQNIYFDFLKYSKSDSSVFLLSDFFTHLPAQEKILFLEKTAPLFVEYTRQHTGTGIYDPLIEEFIKTESLKTAWILSEIDFKNMNSTISEKLFNTILKVLLNKSDLNKADIKEKVFKFSTPYIEQAQYPIKLWPEVKTKYIENGGLIYEDLNMLRLSHQTNLPELAGKFLYYFEKAIFIELIETKRNQNKSTVRIKIIQNLGTLKDIANEKSNSNIFEICKKSFAGETLLLAIDQESLDLLEKLNLKTMILATKSSDYKFLIFDSSFAKQIEGAFTGI
jgi:hypothetical protein